MMTATSVEGVGGVGGELERRVLVHRKLKRIARARAFLDTHEATALREAQRLQLWKQFGHTSLVDYMVRELGYTPRAAEERLRVANALPELPKIAEALQTGELNFSQARELVRVATPQTEQVWIGAVQEKTVREVERAVSGHAKGDLPTDPIDPKLVRTTMWLRVRPETEVLFREARRRLDRERGEKLDDDDVLEALCRVVLASGGRPANDCGGDDRGPHVGGSARDRAEAGSAEHRGPHVGGAARDRAEAGSGGGSRHEGTAAEAGSDHQPGTDVSGSATNRAEANDTHGTHVGGAAPYRVAVTVCKECKRGWQHGAGAVVEMSPAAVERAQCDAQHIGDLTSATVQRATQTIPPVTRRLVLHRDEQRCRVPGCQSFRNLDVHHIVHREHGGTHELSNLIALCEAHHLAHHDGTLRIGRDASGVVTFHREGRNRFTRATREVQTKTALRERGIDRDRVRAILVRTSHHIGEADLSAEQWLAIALRYAGEAGLASAAEA